MDVDEPDNSGLRGFIYGISAYVAWGIIPFYMKAVAHMPAIEVILWIFGELRPAAITAEEIGVAFVLMAKLGRFRLDLHAAYGIDHRSDVIEFAFLLCGRRRGH